MRTRVKICGITRLEDALAAQDLGVDAIGFVFVRASKRHIEPQQAAKIAAQLSPFLTIVGLFLDAPESQVRSSLRQLPGLLPQFHGNESAEYCEALERPYIKAIGMGNGMPNMNSLNRYQSALGFLFDSHPPGSLGGTGEVFDWNQLQTDVPGSLILAGGLDHSNVAQAVIEVAPQALDVSSGVESAKGIKCAEKLQAFMHAVGNADRQRLASL
ncbi:MAG: phosphoribosylanthranilate isomerase [Granulosicoccus sp.]|nr:phosphoribosylanthranilate isomerase [Granulosicoccus sp.]